ncbi:MAG: rhodanese-like domain-containing protein [Bacteroidales bacterium]|nr:rhodanese-like domain-containing protein [Bacteroidales bacterium]
MKRILLMTLVALLAVGCSGSKKSEKNQETKPQDRITILHVNDFEELVHKGTVRVIDVRTRSEFAEGHIAGAENVDVNQPDFIERLRLKGDVAVYCRTGKRSQKAAMMIAEQGYNVYDLGGGIMAWRQSGKPTVR